MVIAMRERHNANLISQRREKSGVVEESRLEVPMRCENDGNNGRIFFRGVVIAVIPGPF